MGAPGFPGLVGVRGLKGESGDDGFRGQPGLQGRPGQKGRDGVPGFPGNKHRHPYCGVYARTSMNVHATVADIIVVLLSAMYNNYCVLQSFRSAWPERGGWRVRTRRPRRRSW